MERINFKRRVEVLSEFGGLPTPEGTEWHVECMALEGERRWQLCLVRKDRIGGDLANLPRHGHWKTRDFASYLDGITDVLALIQHPVTA